MRAPARLVLLSVVSACMTPDVGSEVRTISDAPPTVSAAAPVTATRLAALSDLPFARHRFTVPWTAPPLQVTLHLPSTSTRGPELAVDIERSLRVLTDRWPATPCRPVEHIDVYIVAANVIDDRRRFDLGPRQPEGALWGVCSPHGGAADTVAITVRDLGPADTATVVGHELAHHWHDRLCLPGDTEAFAQAFESLDWPHAVAPERLPEANAGALMPPLSRREARRARRAARRTARWRR